MLVFVANAKIKVQINESCMILKTGIQMKLFQFSSQVNIVRWYWNFGNAKQILLKRNDYEIYAKIYRKQHISATVYCFIRSWFIIAFLK